MQITIDSQSERSIYRQVADEVKALIARGELPEGTPLPAVRQLSADLGVNMNTVAAAYRELQSEGLITIRHGSGAVVTSRQSAESSRPDMRKALRTVLTAMLLGGMKRGEIERAVKQELKFLGGSK